MVPTAAAYAVAGRWRAGYVGRYLQTIRPRANLIPARRTRPAGNRARQAPHGPLFPAGRTGSRNDFADPSPATHAAARRTPANITPRLAPPGPPPGRATPPR